MSTFFVAALHSIRHWTPQRKAEVVRLIRAGTLTREDIIRQLPDISLDELASWERRFGAGGVAALAVTKRHRDEVTVLGKTMVRRGK